MNLYNHLAYKEAKVIINLKNQNMSHYAVAKATSISVGKVKGCAELVRYEKGRKPKINQPWKGPHEIITYSIKGWEVSKVLYKANRACTYAQNALPIYQNFIAFCENLYETNLFVNGKLRKVKRLTNNFIKQFRESDQEGEAPSKSRVYVMAKSNSYPKRIRWLRLLFPKI